MKATLALNSLFALAAAIAVRPNKRTVKDDFPTTTIAGIEVVDTQLVRDAVALIKGLEPNLYAHQMRTWLVGAAMVNHNGTLKCSVDTEAHAVATLLHDLGWDMTPGSPWISSDKRFEIDGAIGATKFIRDNGLASEWPEERLDKVFAGVALHATLSIGAYFPLEIANIVQSINGDFEGPHEGVPDEVIDGIFAEFPNDGFEPLVNQTFVWWAATKPNVTYDTIVQPYGDAFVPGYNSTGHRAFDRTNPPAPQMRFH